MSVPAQPGRSFGRVVGASIIGTTVEWYDLFVFATASALVFNKVFFPDFVPLIGTLLAFGTFASAYLARIVGAATPIVTTALLAATGKGSSVAWYMIGAALISLVALLLLTETFKKDISEIPSVVPTDDLASGKPFKSATA